MNLRINCVTLQYYVFRIATGNIFWKQMLQYKEFHIYWDRDDEGRKYVVSYGGTGLRLCERRWPVTQLECLALLTGIKEYHVYLAGRPFSVYTDHLSRKYLQSLKVSANNRLARWALALQPYTFEINYKEGNKLTAAGRLSRRPYENTKVDEDDDE